MSKRTILCYGDSNTWGAIAHGGRHDLNTRWPAVLRNTLGDNFWVIEEGLGGRTTVFDDPIEGTHKNGARYLLPCLESHQPIDLVILMLGTNDLKHRFGLLAEDIARGAEKLIQIIKHSNCGPDYDTPQILLMAPPPIGKLTDLSHMFLGAEAKSLELGQAYQAVAERQGVYFLDAGQHIRS
ncbi:MAG: hydrolase, partial [Phototrophicales bacterium]